jgi:SAM-dependent methyltransferase
MEDRMPERADRAVSFGISAAAYDRGRPGYPEAALRACLPPRAHRVLDLGAGTGKLTHGLLELGLDVVAVEPLAEMRALIPPAAEVVDGQAEAIPLPDRSVDAVLAGQAFHWFDRARALPEIVRVLRPGGTAGVLWNLFDDRVPWVAAIGGLFGAEDRHSLRRSGELPWRGLPGLTDPEELQFPHAQPADADRLVDNVASRSMVILAPPDRRARLLARVRELAPSGRFEIPYICHVWRAERRD